MMDFEGNVNTPIGNLKFDSGYGYPVCFVGKALSRHNEIVHNVYCKRRKVAELVEVMDDTNRYHVVFKNRESFVASTLDEVAGYIHAHRTSLLEESHD